MGGYIEYITFSPFRQYSTDVIRKIFPILSGPQGVPMKQIQEWLGYSDMSTTANIYSHLDAVSKADTGAAMSKALG